MRSSWKPDPFDGCPIRCARAFHHVPHRLREPLRQAGAVAGVIGPAAMGVLIYPNAYFQLGNAEPTLTGRSSATPVCFPSGREARLNGRPPDVGVLPTKDNGRYFWWDFLEQLDIWWLWVPSAELPKWLWLMVPVFGTGAVAGVVVLRSGLKVPAIREASLQA